MKQSQFISEGRLLKQAIGILMEKLGQVETNRFLSLRSKEGGGVGKKTSKMAV